ncbi:MAG: ribose-5-phosphate isomerase RpiA [Rhodobacteraceae bacterium]|nr:ribose-5-phosphate isomerase RpiA [Paracoccaceae bacterium]
MDTEYAPQDLAKITAAQAALKQFVSNGIRIGLGSGTTSHFFVRTLGKAVRNGLEIVATTTSRSTTSVATDAGIAVTDINAIDQLDLVIDGSDEIDENLRCIKGGGGCLLWEKIVAHAAREVIIICDESKLVTCLGTFPLPVEVVQFGWKRTRDQIVQILADVGVPRPALTRRTQNGHPVTTDSGNYFIACQCSRIEQPESLEKSLNAIPGVVENGLFTREVTGMVVGHHDQSTRTILRNSS